MTLSGLVERQIQLAQPDRSEIVRRLGVRRASVVTTATVLDDAPRCSCWSTLAMRVGKHLDWELAAQRGPVRPWYVERHKHDDLGHKHAAYEGYLNATAGPAPRWSNKDRMLAGTICLEAAARAGLVERVSMGRRSVPRLTTALLEALERQRVPPRRPPQSAPPEWDQGSPAANALSRVPWRYSGRVLSVVRDMVRVGGPLVPPMSLELPPRPHDIDTNPEARKAWRIRAHDARMEDVHARSRRARYLRLARTEPGRVFFPMSTDWRGRLYVDSAGPSYQADEASRACLVFDQDLGWSDGAGQDWLLSVSGWDPCKWQDLREAVREDPVGNRWAWQDAKHPWLTLQACLHWGDGRLPTALDASCHGMQVLSAVARDPAGLRMTGVTHDSDLYQLAADAVLPGAGREALKGPIMTIPYGATEHTVTSMLVRNLGVRREFGASAARDLFDWLRGTMGPAMMVVDWLQDLAGCSEVPLTWRTPDGRTCTQSYLQYRTRRISTRLFGKVRTGRLRVDADRVDRPKARRSIVANVVHSLDAAIAHRVVDSMPGPMGTIHDCFVVPVGHRHMFRDMLPGIARRVLNRQILRGLSEDLGAPVPFPVPEGDLPEFRRGMYR